MEPMIGIEPMTSPFGLPSFYLWRGTRLYIFLLFSSGETLVSRSSDQKDRYGLGLSAINRDSGFAYRSLHTWALIYHGRALPTELHWHFNLLELFYANTFLIFFQFLYREDFLILYY